MIMFKLLLIPIFIGVVIGLVKLGQKGFQLADELEVDEKKADINHKAELAKDVNDYTLKNSGKMKKASSDSVKEFVEK